MRAQLTQARFPMAWKCNDTRPSGVRDRNAHRVESTYDGLSGGNNLYQLSGVLHFTDNLACSSHSFLLPTTPSSFSGVDIAQFE